MQFRHGNVVPNESVTVNTVKSYDLPVGALSFLLVTVKFAQNVADTQLAFSNVLAMVSRLEVLYKGSSVFGMSGLDAFACGILICDFEPWGINAKGDDNELRSITFIVPFTRTLYSPSECYPPTKRGELVLQMTWAATFTEIDGVSLQVESVEVPEAVPERFLKMVSKGMTPTATGEDSVDLPIGNLISDIVLWGTSIPSADTATTTIQKVEIEINEAERYYTGTYFETLHNMAGRLRGAPGYWGSHVHQMDDAAYAQYSDTKAVKPDNHILSNHLLLPFDIFRDGRYAIDARGLSQFALVVDFGDINPIRVIPAEIVEASKGV